MVQIRIKKIIKMMGKEKKLDQEKTLEEIIKQATHRRDSIDVEKFNEKLGIEGDNFLLELCRHYGIDPIH